MGRWAGRARKYFWGDPLDVRFQVCRNVAGLRNATVLDLACNCGVITSFLDASNRVYGIDTNAEAIGIARSLNPPSVTFSVGDMFDAPYPPESFDVVIASHVVPQHDFPSDHTPAELTDLAWRLLKPGGTLYLTSPNGERPFYRKKNKITGAAFAALLPADRWDAWIRGWDPFPVRLGHALRFMPGMLNILAFLMEHRMRKNQCVSWYARATKRADASRPILRQAGHAV
jgi:SAM-dependent methyltransferase